MKNWPVFDEEVTSVYLVIRPGELDTIELDMRGGGEQTLLRAFDLANLIATMYHDREPCLN